ncbi:acyltransferase family protein [Nocardioides cheoyonin]|uniref:acyltransferase family protein n=1 Tax=Nocardioides cheoyonin TaxID=3156615 RepID=UPI0032B5A412
MSARTRAAHSPSTAPPVRKARDPLFDNAKMALVTLVVVGHSLVMLKDATTFGSHLYDFLYAWHMPAFVLVTGYLSRTFSYSRARLWSLVRSVAVPYIVMEAALAIFRELVGGEHLHTLWIEPHWPMWFLPALFFWRLMTPLLRRIGPAVIVIAIGLSIVGGYVDIDVLQLRRVLGFLPFFAIGLCLTPQLLDRLRTLPVRVAAVASFVGLWILTGYTEQFAQPQWFFYSYAYENLTDTALPALVVRSVVLVMGIVGAFSALALIPRSRGWFTRMGAASLVVYLCHGFVVKAVEYSPYDIWGRAHIDVALPLTIAGAVVLALLLASPWVSHRLERAVDPLSYAEVQLRQAVELHVIAADLDRQRRAEPELAGATT